MDRKDKSLTKKRGRPAGVKHGEFLGLRIPSELAQRVDDWGIGQPEPRPSRSEAIRRLVEKGLASEGVDECESSRQSDASLNRQIAEQKAAIAEIPTHSEPSPEAGMAAMDKAVAENDLIDMKNKRTGRKNAKRG